MKYDGFVQIGLTSLPVKHMIRLTHESTRVREGRTYFWVIKVHVYAKRVPVGTAVNL